MSVRLQLLNIPEDKESEEYGPVDFIQVTYNELRIGPDGDSIAHLMDGIWVDDFGRQWTDFTIW